MEKDNKHIDHGLLTAYLLGEADEIKIAQVEHWLSLSEDNTVYLKSLEMLWIETGKLTPPPLNVDRSLAWNKVSEKLNFSNEIRTEKKESRIIFKPIWRAAAVIILALGLYGIFQIGSSKIQTLASQNEILKDTLQDGSVISLNVNSTITFPKKFKKDSRRINLKGEAFFNVEHNKKKPFIVELEGAEIKVLGTSFNVKEIPEEHMVEVFVQTGTVQLTGFKKERDTSSIVLENGEKGYINTRTGEVGKKEDIGMNANIVTWLSNKFVFEEVRLEDVAAFLENYYVISIEFENSGLKDSIYSGKFENDNIDHILEVIAISFETDVEKSDHTYLFKKYEK